MILQRPSGRTRLVFAGSNKLQIPAACPGRHALFRHARSADGRYTALMPHAERVFRNLQMSWTDGDLGAASPWMRMLRLAR